MSKIPSLDIRRFDTDKDAFVAELGAAYREWGFCGISGHGLSTEALGNAYDVFKQFFALPTDVKLKYHLKGTGGARGVSKLADVWRWLRRVNRECRIFTAPSDQPDGAGARGASNCAGRRVSGIGARACRG